MTLTRKIIDEVVSKSIKSELIPVNLQLAEITNILKEQSKKIDNLTNTVTDFAGDVKKFDEEQTFMGHHITRNTAHIENLEKQVFGQIIVD